MLTSPLPGDKPRDPTPEEVEAEGAAFMALMTQTQSSAQAGA